MKKYHWPRRVLSLLLCLVLAIGFFPAGAIDRAEAATGYVTDNLVLHLDANNNTGSGFDANATTWKNLAPGGELIKVNGQTWGTESSTGAHYLSFNENYILLPDSVVGPGAVVKRTILNEKSSIGANAVVGEEGKITVVGDNSTMVV